MRYSQTNKILFWIYQQLYKTFGPQGWWPADSPFEVIIGAILTQNTAWSNVKRAIDNLKEKGLLDPQKLKGKDARRLARLIRPAGYYNLKARRLKEFLEYLFFRYQGDIQRMFKTDYLKLRQELLEVEGIGLETADSILLYAGKKPIFVVDAYTKRILFRHNLIDRKATYSQIQNLFMDHLPESVQLFNQFHALLVRLGKDICKKVPLCVSCPLKELNRLIRHFCDSCGKDLPRALDRYILKIELYASPEVEISKEELKGDIKEELERIIKEASSLGEEELREQVHSLFRFELCKRCRDKFIQRLKHKEFI